MTVIILVDNICMFFGLKAAFVCFENPIVSMKTVYVLYSKRKLDIGVGVRCFVKGQFVLFDRILSCILLSSYHSIL